MRDVSSVRREHLLRKMELRGMEEATIRSRLLRDGISPQIVDGVMQGKGNTTMWRSLSKLMEEPEGAFEFDELVSNQEVAIQTGTLMYGNSVRCLARSRHFPDVGALEVLVQPSVTSMYSRFFQYLFNCGNERIQAEWDGHKHSLEPLGSMVIKPFVEISLSCPGSCKVFVAKVPGCVSLDTVKECSLFAESGFQRLTSNKSKWW